MFKITKQKSPSIYMQKYGSPLVCLRNIWQPPHKRNHWITGGHHIDAYYKAAAIQMCNNQAVYTFLIGHCGGDV